MYYICFIHYYLVQQCDPPQPSDLLPLSLVCIYLNPILPIPRRLNLRTIRGCIGTEHS